MLKCFFVISIVIPCKAERPDKAFNCVCHACWGPRFARDAEPLLSTQRWGETSSPSLLGGHASPLPCGGGAQDPSIRLGQVMWPFLVWPFMLPRNQGHQCPSSRHGERMHLFPHPSDSPGCLGRPCGWWGQGQCHSLHFLSSVTLVCVSKKFMKFTCWQCKVHLVRKLRAWTRVPACFLPGSAQLLC